MAKRDFGNNIVKEEKVLAPFKFNPIDVKRTYGVLLVFIDEKQTKLQIHYEVDIICLEQVGRFYNFEVNKKQIYINEKAPDTTIDELVERCGKVLYPLQLKVNSLGLATSIINHKMIQERWITERQKIKQSYHGKDVDLLLKNMDDILEDVNQTAELLLQRDWFSVLFFTSIYQNKEKEIVRFPLIPYTPTVAYEIKQIHKSHLYREEDIIIEQKGKCIDTRSENDILKGNLISANKGGKVITGKSDIKYHIYKKSPIVDAITGSCQIKFPSGKSKKVEIEIYNLKEKTPKTLAEKNKEQKEIEKETLQPKKQKKKYFSFWKK